MKELRTGAFLGTACLLAGLGPFVLSGREVQRLAVAVLFCALASAPFFFSDRGLGLSVLAVLLGLSALASIGGVWLVESIVERRALLVRNLQVASAGALCAALLAGILWARDVIRGQTDGA